MKVKVEAKTFPDRIELTQHFEDTYISGSPTVNMHREILKLKDAAVRDALISLGWTPPTESSKSPIEEHQNFEAFIRAFWRRIEPYKNDHGKELPKEMPVEFIWAISTAAILLREITEQPQQAKQSSGWLDDHMIRSARISICKLLGLPLDTSYESIKADIERLKRENEVYKEHLLSPPDEMSFHNSIAMATRNLVDNGDGTFSVKRPTPFQKNKESGDDQ